MRVSQQYKLRRKQAELDFVDVPLDAEDSASNPQGRSSLPL